LTVRPLGATLPAMIAHMVSLVTIPSAASGVRRVRISVPLIGCLVDGQRYFLPGDLPAAEGLDLRAIARPKIGGPAAPPVKSDRSPGRPRSSRLEDELAKLLGEAV
jgi:hypothetical protein